MDIEDLKALADEWFKRIAKGWQEKGLHDGYFISIDPRKSPDDVAALNVLKQKGLVKGRGMGAVMWTLTDAGKQEALRVLGL